MWSYKKLSVFSNVINTYVKKSKIGSYSGSNSEIKLWVILQRNFFFCLVYWFCEGRGTIPLLILQILSLVNKRLDIINLGLTLSKNDKFWTLKEFADNNLKFDENGRKLSKRVENTVGNGEIARHEQFLIFLQCFQKLCTTDT